ncbi:Heterogeneous nuclear ribonucleoprotein 1 [Platanthera guangdongensis]|uniref:Heterogeneous nuclear ribonucleoprotein 1 n=1 Tax=Platanthera guangdongensis TaxID=2320717 RepID=A0ABR2MDF7_9ASPA
MDSDRGKLFIGGISWDTNEDRLREYFNNFGEVVEAVIMKDRATGRARGFGFVIFSDPAVAENVVTQKHLIDGRMVEAKKAVPRDDQHMLNRNKSSIQGSPAPLRTKKIFVGGLASTVTDADFKQYFEQFGTINDVVVMYDHNTQRPRGFGFITFDSEDAVDKVLHKTFHELNGKMVEVKIAVPKELSPGPNARSPLGALNRMNSFFNGYGVRMDGRFGASAGGRKRYPSFTPGYNIELNIETGMSPTYGGGSNLSNGIGFGRALSPYYRENSSRFGGIGSAFGSTASSLWGNPGFNYGANPIGSNSLLASARGSLSGFGNGGLKWGGGLSSPLSANDVRRSSLDFSGNLNYGNGENSFGFVGGSYGRNNGTGSMNASSLSTNANGFEGNNYTDSYGGGSMFGGGSIYGDTMWQSALSELDGSSPFGYGLAAASDVTSKGGSPRFLGAYNVSNRQMNRGVAA